jgi:hypothetical protein
MRPTQEKKYRQRVISVAAKPALRPAGEIEF